MLSRLVGEIDALGRGPRERELPDLLADVAERALRVRSVLVFLRRRDGDLALVAQRGRGKPRRVRVVPGEGMVGRAVSERRLVGRAEGASAASPGPAWEERVEAVAPIRCGGKVLGAIAVGAGPEGAEDAAAALEVLGAVAGLALVNARALGEGREARRAADFDPLTGLRNKRSFLEQLERAVEEAEAAEEPLSLLIFDIDHFKHYNDHHGHPAGDRVLSDIGKLVRRGFRDRVDVAARFGGEEFCVLFRGTSKERAHELAERFRREVEHHPFKHATTQPGGRLTVSGGIAAYPDDAGDAAALLEVADQWLYESKRMSRNRMSLAEGEAGPRVTEITQHR